MDERRLQARFPTERTYAQNDRKAGWSSSPSERAHGPTSARSEGESACLGHGETAKRNYFCFGRAMTRQGLYISQVGLQAAEALREQAKTPRGNDGLLPVERPPDEIFRRSYDFDEAYL